MGCLIRSCFSLLLGTTLGMYVAQNYDVPKLKNLFNKAMVTAKQKEEQYRKKEEDSK
ncbi:hypothetical protein COCNU_scaffold017943G000010 [Cocos nucifera]|nr:hypothetical protein [Cocos nucifera]